VGLNVQGLPIVKPPYGVLTAINLDRGDIQWQVPFGDTPDSVRNHPLLRGMNIPKTGLPEATHSGGVGIIITKTLVIAGDGMVTSPPGRPRGAMLRAFNKATGEEVGAVWMPAQQSGTPMTYLHNGKQYIRVPRVPAAFVASETDPRSHQNHRRKEAHDETLEDAIRCPVGDLTRNACDRRSHFLCTFGLVILRQGALGPCQDELVPQPGHARVA
jgi:hypothetical protein